MYLDDLQQQQNISALLTVNVLEKLYGCIVCVIVSILFTVIGIITNWLAEQSLQESWRKCWGHLLSHLLPFRNMCRKSQGFSVYVKTESAPQIHIDVIGWLQTFRLLLQTFRLLLQTMALYDYWSQLWLRDSAGAADQVWVRCVWSFKTLICAPLQCCHFWPGLFHSLQFNHDN